MSNWYLPPRYVEVFDSTNDIFKELLMKCKNVKLWLVARLQEDQQRRIMPKFDDEENKKVDRLIRENIREITNKIKQCEENIKSMAFEKVEMQKESLGKNMNETISTR